ncbi:precorrin-6A synthase (deacetylating) [Amycolatopsis sp. cg5]|uniref:precorrin-6A synthase (deacetylating) n=1 Tax=Amycolatopsis sp. cg5 TaxID=3238802 RepID=UPI003525A38E
MRRLYVIGIGAGDPEHLTVQAINRLNEVDVFFVLDKGKEKADLVRLRHEILDRYVTRPYRLAEARDPERDRTPADYEAEVKAWHGRRVDVYQGLITGELRENEVGAFLVWGDPALYDSTITLLNAVQERGIAFDYTVIPGVSSVSVLAAQHRTTFNRIGTAVQITTGRRLADGWPDGAADVLVMLDAHCTFTRFTGEDMDIFWGAYLGTPDELVVSGRLADVAEEIVALRSQARERKGWIMDTYLLRRN